MASTASPCPTQMVFNRPPVRKTVIIRSKAIPESELDSSLSSPSSNEGKMQTLSLRERTQRNDIVREKEIEARERKEEVNRKIASQKAISVILRREATKAVIEKKKGPNYSRKLLPRTVLEALHERITALRWESALKVTFQI